MNPFQFSKQPHIQKYLIINVVVFALLELIGQCYEASLCCHVFESLDMPEFTFDFVKVKVESPNEQLGHTNVKSM